MLFAKIRATTLVPLMESRLVFATQKDVAKKEGVKFRYISDTRDEINERIKPQKTTHCTCTQTWRRDPGDIVPGKEVPRRPCFTA